MQLKLNVSGMTCQNCVKHVTKALQEVPGLSDIAVSLEDGSASFTASPEVDLAAVKAAITEAGYQVN